MRKEKSIEIIGGNNAEEIAQFAADELKGAFCSTEEEFEQEWPGTQGKKYRVTVVVSPI